MQRLNETLNPIGYTLGTNNSRPNDVDMKSFSTSIFKVFIWIIATNTKICTISRLKRDSCPRLRCN